LYHLGSTNCAADGTEKYTGTVAGRTTEIFFVIRMRPSRGEFFGIILDRNSSENRACQLTRCGDVYRRFSTPRMPDIKAGILGTS
jgi:hypothetical protein